MTRKRFDLAPLTFAVGVAACLVWAVAAPHDTRPALSWSAGPLATWAVILVGFSLAEWGQLHVELNRQTLSLSLSEIPLVLGLFLLAPLPLIAARLGATVLVSLQRRSPPAKVAFNLVLFALGTELVEVVFRSVVAGADSGPRTWAAVYLAVILAELVTVALVALAISHLQGAMTPADLRHSTVTAFVSTSVNTTVALLVLIVGRSDARALVLVLVLLAALAGAYRAYSVLLRRHNTLDLMHTFTAAVRGVAELSDLVPEVLRQGKALLTADMSALMLRDMADGGWLLFRGDAPAQHVDTVDDVVALVMADHSVLLPRGTGNRAHAEWLELQGLRDAVLCPVRDGEQTVGCLIVGNRVGTMATFSGADLQLLETVSAHVAVALLGVRLVERLRYEARHDALTGLPNRTYFSERLARSVDPSQAPRHGAVLLLDLDGFKDVNDTLGHHNGDLMLREVGMRLLAAVPPSVTVARLGGDEFALLVPGEREEDDSRLVASLLHRVLRRPFSIEGVPLEIRASIGVARFPRDGSDERVLLQRADVAMYAAKNTHSAVRVYEPDLDHSSPRRLTLAAQLRTAIDEGELVCYYQPKVSMSDRKVVGVEALVRWRHPTLGVVPPDDFIEIAEHTGLIVPLTSLVLREAVTQCAAWLAAGQVVGVAVNVTPRGLLAADFVDEVATVLRDTGLPAPLLTLELTESSVLSDPVGAAGVLRRLHDVGVRLSIDDFGTGYSSLTYLQRLPVDEVKIDMSFVHNLASDPNNAAIVRAIIELAHALGKYVVAEGVEDQTAFDMLASYGCDTAQGYLMSRPLPAEVATSWLAEATPWGRPIPVRPRLSIA